MPEDVNGQTENAGEANQPPTTDSGATEGAQPGQQLESLKVKVWGEEREVPLTDPNLQVYVQKGLAYDRKVEELNKSVDTQVQAKLEEIQQKQREEAEKAQREQYYKEVGTVDPLEEKVLRLTDEVQSMTKAQQESERQRVQELQNLRWEQTQQEARRQFPDLKPADWDVAYAKMINKQIPLTQAAKEVVDDRTKSREQIRAELLEELKQNATKPPPSGDGGAGAPINPGEEKFTSPKDPRFKERVAAALSERFAQQ